MKKFIKLPNAIWSYRLNSGELQVYTALIAFSNRFGACCVRHATVAELCGVSSATVARAIGQLSSKGLISISKRYDRQGQLVANKYLVTPLSGSFTRVPCNIWGYKLAKSDFKVYLYLLCCCAQNILEAVPSLSQMVSVLHMSKRTIIDAVNRLSQLLLLYKEQYRRKQDKRMGHNRYRLIIGMARRLLVTILAACASHRQGRKEKRAALRNRATRTCKRNICFSITTIAHVVRKVKDFLCSRAFLFRHFIGTVLIRQ